MTLVKAALILSLLATAACERQPDQTATAPAQLTIWAHAGQEDERRTLQDLVRTFDRRRDDLQARLTFIPERMYNAQIQAAAIAGDLPDVVELDGPYLYSYVWQGHLQPLDGLLPARVLDDLIRSVRSQGSYRGRLWAVGMFDSALVLYARRSALDAAGFAVPASPAEAWTVDEFERLLATLAVHDSDGAVLDLKLNYPAEWFTYAFSPILQSAGADLIDRHDYASAAGVINGPRAVAAMRHVQSWFRRNWVDPNVDDAAFVTGRVALSWAGHWEYERYHAAAGDDLAVVPLPDFGRGTRTGQGSWMWGIARGSTHSEAAAAFLEFLLQPDQVTAMCRANNAVPATGSAIRRSPLYKDSGALHLAVRQLLGGYAVPRPKTPAYPVISSAFREAFANIRNGDDVQAALDRAAAVIDRDIRDNHGYPPAAGG